jgi:hypothetical protein
LFDYGSSWVLRKIFEWLRLSGSKARRFCPSEAKAARFQASLSSPFGRGTMPAQPSNGFLTTQPVPYNKSLHFFETTSLSLFIHGFMNACYE